MPLRWRGGTGESPAAAPGPISAQSRPGAGAERLGSSGESAGPAGPAGHPPGDGLRAPVRSRNTGSFAMDTSLRWASPRLQPSNPAHKVKVASDVPPA